MSVKVRIGIALGGYADAAGFTTATDRLEELGADSLWLQEMVYGPLVEPFTGMTQALARTRRLKVGTAVAVLPGRHPVLVAKQLATLAALAPGRVLPAFGLQPARADERPVFPVPPGQRGAVFDESLELLRMLLREENGVLHRPVLQRRGCQRGPAPGPAAGHLDGWQRTGRVPAGGAAR